MGRFITADTIVPYASDPQSLNRYSYCRNNPINLIDPTGHKWSWKNFWKAAVAAVVSAVVFVATGGTATPVIAGFWAGMAGGAVAGALSGGGINAILQGAAFGAVTGAALGGIGAWGVANVSKNFGYGMLAAAGGYSAATGNLDSFAGGVVGGIAGGAFTNTQQFQNWQSGRGFRSDTDVRKYVIGKIRASASGDVGLTWDDVSVTRDGRPSMFDNSGGRSLGGGGSGGGGRILGMGEASSGRGASGNRGSGGSVRYVGSGEANYIESNGSIPNVNQKGNFKNVFYTNDSPLNSGAQAQAAYNLETAPTHRVVFSNTGVTNTYGGNVQGGTGTELITRQSISVGNSKVEKLDP